MLKLGVIGYGKRANDIWAKSMKDVGLVTVAAIADPQIETIKVKYGENLPGCRYYTDAKEMLDNEKLDGVLVATRCNLHTKFARLVAQYDLPLFLEKPVSVTKEELEERIANNTILEILNKVSVKKGDVFFIEAGTVHAIGKGMVICEIQQNSNTTYRVYDYDRRDKNGNARELHIKKAVDVARLTPSENYTSENKNIIAKCKYFTSEILSVVQNAKLEMTDECFKSVIVTEGSGILYLNGKELEFKAGESIFIPAQSSIAEIKGECELIISYV